MFYANEDPAFRLGLINNALETVVITVKDIFTNALLFVAGEGAGEGISVGVGALRAARVARAVQAGRLEYEAAVTALSGKATSMASQGMTAEQIARALSAERRALGVQFKNLTPPNLLEKIYARNLAEYGDKLGPTVDWFRAKGRTWEQIIESACRSGGKDLGF